MILVDTSVWVDHLREGIPLLCDLLNAGEVTTHPFVIGELACGNIRSRAKVLKLLGDLPSAILATHEEAIHTVESNALQGTGIGWVDVHLLASALLSRTPIWSRDKPLNKAAEKLGIAGRA
jgi:hypothetical protein